MYETSIRGLDKTSHLRDVISNDQPHLDQTKAAKDTCDAFRAGGYESVKAVLLECTNLPPYKQDLRKVSPIPIYDILTAIEAVMPNAVQPHYL